MERCIYTSHEMNCDVNDHLHFLEIISMKCPMQKRARVLSRESFALLLANAFLGLIAKTVAQLASSSTYCHTTLFDCQVEKILIYSNGVFLQTPLAQFFWLACLSCCL